jgi:hypothetical protein
MENNKSLLNYIPLIFTLSFTCFVSYTTITQIIVPNQAWTACIIHLTLLILVLWSLFATKLTDPGYVSTSFYSNETDIE